MDNKQDHRETDQVLISRVFDAPRDIVFNAWTDPAQLVQWYAPTGCSIKFEQIDIRTGGGFLSCITIPDGKECWCKGIYLEISYPEKIIHSMAVSDEKGNMLSALDAGMDPDWPQETILTVSFEAMGDRTKLILHQTVAESLAKRTGAYPSWLIMFDRLDNLLASLNN